MRIGLITFLLTYTYLVFSIVYVYVCADQTFSIVGFSGTEGLNFNMSGTIVTKPALNVTLGEKITFRIETYMEYNEGFNKGPLPFGLCEGLGCTPDDFTSAALGSLTPSASCVTNSSFLANAYYVNPATGIPCILTWTVPQPREGYDLFYTSRSQVYKNKIFVSGIPTASPAGSGSTTAPPSGSTTSPPTTTGTPTTTPAPGKNSAAVIIPAAGAVVLIITAINALFA